ncbi:MAG TPA: radical SAM protein [Longimicrobium sp.]|nr:radical SAM protein [Longimicrobium sp.]
MYVGFAVTEHCNLRCPHCIRDDVTTVRNLPPELLFRTVDDALEIFGKGQVTASMTGGEPTLHPHWAAIVAGLHDRGVPYRFVTNGWHMRRLMPSLDRHPPEAVRVSLSGATEQVHDEERGRGSFRRVLQAMALLTSRRIPAALSIVIDRRDRHQVRLAADLAEALGCVRLHFILPQPVPGSAARDSDLPPGEWSAVRDEVRALQAEPGRRTALQLDYGYPFDGPEQACETFSGQRVYVDARGRLSMCCQLSEYGFNEHDVVADLNETPFREVWPRYVEALRGLQARTAARDPANPFDAFPCMRCARALGKTAFLGGYPDSPWHGAAAPGAPALVTLGYRAPARAAA